LGLGVAAGLAVCSEIRSGDQGSVTPKADEGKEYLKRRTYEVRDQATDAIERGKSTVLRQRENLVAAVEAGKQAYREAVSSTPNDAEHI
jgi:hypothetical protein